MSDPKRTMTLNLRAEEMAFVEERAAYCDMSKTAVIRQALRLYQLVLHHEARGSHISFSGDPPMRALFVGPGFEPGNADSPGNGAGVPREATPDVEVGPGNTTEQR